MATLFLSTAKTILPNLLSSSPPPSPSSSPSSLISQPSIQQNVRPRLNLYNGATELPNNPSIFTKRNLSLSLTTTFFLSLAGKGSSHVNANAAILEADDDVELLERVKKDRIKRLEKQEAISSSNKETAYLQDVVYKLSKVGQAIENNDFSTANSVLNQGSNADWVKKANAAFTKLSSSPEEITEIDTFNVSLASLISSVTQKDVEASKVAFFSSASAFEKWTALAGLVGQLKGL